ncbi:MAG TPA: type II secretion system F family protein [Jiangellaceae bacterium]
MTAVGAALGLVAGLGLVLIWTRLPFRRDVGLAERVSPYVTDVREVGWTSGAAGGERTVTPLPTLERLVRPYLSAGADALERVLGGSASVRRRLDQAGSSMSVHQFRIEQLVWGALAFAGAVMVSLVLQAGGRSPAALVVFCVAAAVSGVVARDQKLTRDVRHREQQMMAEFPAVADLLALAVAAGEAPVNALERVSRTSHGELGAELNRALAETRTGTGLIEALDRIGARTSLPQLARFTDGIAVALERGTPLADVLRAQAADVREARKRHLMEVGGRKEIAMMIPVVFLILPVTVLFALYPGLIQINAIVP